MRTIPNIPFPVPEESETRVTVRQFDTVQSGTLKTVVVLDRWYEAPWTEIMDAYGRRMFPEGPDLGGPEPVTIESTFHKRQSKYGRRKG